MEYKTMQTTFKTYTVIRPNKFHLSSNYLYAILIILFGVGYFGLARSELPEVPFPIENPVSEDKRLLGKILFWEEQLSSDNTVACGTCHQPTSGGADGRQALHPGLDLQFGTDDDVIGSHGIARYDNSMQAIDDPIFGFKPQVTGRTSPSFINAMYSGELFWDGRAGPEFNDPQNPNITIISTGGALEKSSCWTYIKFG